MWANRPTDCHGIRLSLSRARGFSRITQTDADGPEKLSYTRRETRIAPDFHSCMESGISSQTNSSIHRHYAFGKPIRRKSASVTLRPVEIRGKSASRTLPIRGNPWKSASGNPPIRGNPCPANLRPVEIRATVPRAGAPSPRPSAARPRRTSGAPAAPAGRRRSGASAPRPHRTARDRCRSGSSP